MSNVTYSQQNVQRRITKVICKCTRGPFHTCCVTVFLFCSMAVSICAYQFVFMRVCSRTRICAFLCACGNLIWSIWPFRLSSGAPGVNVSQNPSVSRPPEALVCTYVCLFVCTNLAGSGKQTPPLQKPLWTLCVCKRGRVYVYVVC